MGMTQDELVVILDGVGGWLNEQEAYHLYTLAAQVKSGVIVEIGAYHGRSTLALAYGGVYTYSIDPHFIHTQGGIQFTDLDGLQWIRNISTAPDRHGIAMTRVIKPVFLPSEVVGKCWQYPIGLLFIDGMHDNVDSDWNDFSPHVTPDGRIAVHDSTGAWDAPTALVKRVVDSGAWALETQIGYTSVLKRGNA